MNFDLSELGRRLANIIRIGVVDEADYKKARLKIAIGDRVTGWLPWITRKAGNDIDWFVPETGEQVLILCPDGDPAQGVVLGSIYQNKYPSPQDKETISYLKYEDGTTIQYDREKSELKLSAVGDVIADIEGNIITTVKGNMEANVKGDMIAKVEGKTNIESKKDITAKASGNIDFESSKNLNIKANGNIEIKASGTMKIKGAMVEFG